MADARHDLVIIGAGPAGLSASIYARRALLDTLVIEQGAFGGQISLTATIDNYPGVEETSGAELSQRMQGQAEGFGAQFAYDSVEAIERTDGGFVVRCTDASYESTALVMASGAVPRHAGFDGEERFAGHGVSYCATCDGMFYRGKRVFVVGGGNTACEEALFLTRFASHVTLVVRKDHVRAAPSVARELEENEKLDVRYLTSIVSVDGDVALSSVAFRDNATGETSVETFDEGGVGVFVFVGNIPSTQLLAGLVELAPDGSVITDEAMATKTPGLFCAGDVRSKPLRQVVTAAADGAIAAVSASTYLGKAVES
ncbi:MAG: FAD-dependent oxidoreductase [Atopobiaceae bacterium]|jgi:thioredoxin reductase (NADPH)|nr:FAD-dependent oxidoreductase [Atopobiaceae bacterium]